jgi:quercetin dioxygenase-like cupin family protein
MSSGPFPTEYTMRTLFLSPGLLLAASVWAQAPINVEFEPHHKTVLTTPVLRILEVIVREGDETLDHTHQYDIATVCIECATTQTRSPGEAWSGPRPRDVGGVLIAEYSGKPSAHAVRTMGKGTYHLVGVENLHATFGSTAKPLDNRVQTTLSQEARAFRVYDFRLAAGDGPLRHTHTVPTVVVLVSGVAKVNKAASKDTREMTQPGEWQLVPAGEDHSFTATKGKASHLVEIEVR